MAQSKKAAAPVKTATTKKSSTKTSTSTKSSTKKTGTTKTPSTKKAIPTPPTVTPLEFTEEHILGGNSIHERLLRGERVPYRDFIKHCRLDLYMEDINRAVDDKKVEDLANSIQQNGACYKDIVLFDAPTIWKYNHKLYRHNEAGEREEVPTTLPGATVCAYSPGDGQHRGAAAAKLMETLSEEEFAKLDINVRLETREVDPATYIATVNTHQYGWNASQKRSVVEKRFTSPTLDFTKKVTEKPYKMRLRSAFKLIYLTEVYNKSIYDNSLEMGKLDPKLEASPDKLERAERLLESFIIGFGKNTDLLKNAAAVDCVVDKYTDATDDKKTEVVNQLNTFFRTLPDTVIEQLKKEPVVANKTTILNDNFEVFVKDYKTEAGKSMYDEKAEKALSEYKASLEKEEGK